MTHHWCCSPGHHSFLVTARCIPLFGNTMFYLFISWWTFDVFPLFWLWGIMPLWTFMYPFLCEHTFPFFWVSPWGELQGHIVILCWTFETFQILYCITALHPLSSSVLRSNFPTSSSALVISYLLARFSCCLRDPVQLLGNYLWAFSEDSFPWVLCGAEVSWPCLAVQWGLCLLWRKMGLGVGRNWAGVGYPGPLGQFSSVSSSSVSFSTEALLIRGSGAWHSTTSNSEGTDCHLAIEAVSRAMALIILPHNTSCLFKEIIDADGRYWGTLLHTVRKFCLCWLCF